MAWKTLADGVTARPAASCPSFADFEDAVATSELQWSTNVPPAAPANTGSVRSSAWVASNVQVSGTPPLTTATRGGVEGVRTWNYNKAGHAPYNLVAGTVDDLGRVPLSWLNDPVPAWAQSITQIQVEKNGVIVATINWASSTTYAGAGGDSFRVRYRNSRDTTLVSDWSNADTAEASGGGSM